MAGGAREGLDGLLGAWLLDGRGGGRRLDWEEVAGCKPRDGEWLWLHLNYSTPEVQHWMWENSGLSELTVEALLQVETRPRCVSADEGLMLFLRGVNLNPGADPEDMVSIRLWVGERRVISLRVRRLLSMDDLRQALERGDGPTSPGEFLVLLVDRLLDRAANVIDETYDEVDELEDSVLVAADHHQREQLAGIRRQAIALRRFLAPQREALNRLYAERTPVLTDEYRLRLREDFDRLTRFVEDLDAVRERAGVIHESLVSRIAEQTNQRMYILSIIAAIFLPLSFVTGLLGVNVGGIPGADNALGFTIVVGLMVLIAGGLWAFFHWRRWF
ncbi:MAG: zinc transporter ZntB [Gammaproteobacteria bacterium]|jgi:zinc transporter